MYSGNQKAPRRIASWSFVFICVHSLTINVLADEARFRNEAPEAWNSYVEAVQHGMVAETTVNVTVATGVTSGWVTTSELSKPSARHLRRQEGTARVRIANERYSAILESENETDWSIENVGRPYSEWGMDSETDRRSTQGRASMQAMRGLTLWTMWLPEIVANPGFNIVEASNSPDGYSVEFTYDYQGDKDVNHEALKGGTLLFSPEENWLIKSANIDFDWKSRDESGTMEVSNTLERLSSDLTHAAENKIAFDTRINGKQQGSEWTWSQSANASGPKAKDPRFFLSHYGVAEPIAYQQNSKPLGVSFWLGVGAFCLLATAFLIRHNSKKQSS